MTKYILSLIYVLLIGYSPVWAQNMAPKSIVSEPIDLKPQHIEPHYAQAQAEPTDPSSSIKTETPSDDNELTGILNQNEDYSHLTPKAERALRLDKLFSRLKEADEEQSQLIVEEIWSLWTDSGSASVNLLLKRGIDFEKSGDQERARRMYDHVTTLAPDFAEGWARSARLAYEEEDFNRALVESITALNLEPREFYVLWTLGRILETLGRKDEAYEIYLEAIDLYPEHPNLKNRVESMRTEIEGNVL